MYTRDRPHSPKYIPQPLRPPPYHNVNKSPRTPINPTNRSVDVVDGVSTSNVYPTVIRKTFDDPHEALCRAFNVTKIQLEHDSIIPNTIDMPMRHGERMPTHALLVLGLSPPPSTSVSPSIPATRPNTPVPMSPFILPVNAELFASKFSYEVPFPSTRSRSLQVPRLDSSTGAQVATLPVVAISMPHPPSVPLLLLFGLGLAPSVPSPNSASCVDEDQDGQKVVATQGPSLLATFLLPVEAIGEFPAASAMAGAMARVCNDEELGWYVAHNHGLWTNILVLAPKDGQLVDTALVAWNVTVEAKRIRERRTYLDNIRINVTDVANTTTTKTTTTT